MCLSLKIGCTCEWLSLCVSLLIEGSIFSVYLSSRPLTAGRSFSLLVTLDLKGSEETGGLDHNKPFSKQHSCILYFIHQQTVYI